MKRWVEKTAAESKNDFISYLNILWIPSAALSKWEMDFCSLLMKHQLVVGSFTKVFCLVSQAGSLLTWRRESLNEPCYDAALAPVLSPNWLTVPWLTRFGRRENKRIWWNVRTGRKLGSCIPDCSFYRWENWDCSGEWDSLGLTAGLQWIWDQNLSHRMLLAQSSTHQKKVSSPFSYAFHIPYVWMLDICVKPT